jgi:hypothetical protein
VIAAVVGRGVGLGGGRQVVRSEIHAISAVLAVTAEKKFPLPGRDAYRRAMFSNGRLVGIGIFAFPLLAWAALGFAVIRIV